MVPVLFPLQLVGDGVVVKVPNTRDLATEGIHLCEGLSRRDRHSGRGRRGVLNDDGVRGHARAIAIERLDHKAHRLSLLEVLPAVEVVRRARRLHTVDEPAVSNRVVLPGEPGVDGLSVELHRGPQRVICPRGVGTDRDTGNRTNDPPMVRYCRRRFGHSQPARGGFSRRPTAVRAGQGAARIRVQLSRALGVWVMPCGGSASQRSTPG